MVEAAKKAIKEKEDAVSFLRNLAFGIEGYIKYLSSYPVRFIVDPTDFRKETFDVFDNLLNVRETLSPNVVETLKNILKNENMLQKENGRDFISDIVKKL